MFKCARCGSRYSAMHAATIENCPRCLIRERTSVPLSFTAFQLPDRGDSESLAALAMGKTAEGNQRND